MWPFIFGRLAPAGPRGRLSTLIFHRVLAEADPLFPEETDAARFDAVCGWLARWFHVIPLDDAVRRLARRDLPARALCITFDDGYADNHDVALPILRRHGLPATFFVATGFLDGGRMWNDTVIEALRRCEAPTLDLSALGIASLGALDLGGDTQRRAAIDAVLGAIKYLPIEERLAVAGRIAERASVRLPDDLMMTSGQVRALRRAGMQIGAHTVSHPILAGMDDGAARREIGAGKARLEAILGERVDLFAYPNGRPGRDFDERSVALVREAGFTAAVTTAPGISTASTDPFRLPRFTPWDRGRSRFAARLGANLVARPA